MSLTAPPVHYRVDLGGYGGAHSYIVQTAKGVVWDNVPPELELILKTPGSTIMDFSLGDNGQFFVKYELGGQVWGAASTDLKGRLDGLLVARSALGAKDTYWFETTNALGVAERVTFKADQAYVLPTNARTAITSLGISSLTLGASKHYFFVKDGVPYNSRHNGLQKMMDQVGLGRKVTSVVISPLDAALYLITIDDGTVYMSLPNAIKKKLAPLMRPEYSLIRGRVNSLPVPRSLLPKSPNQTSAATARPPKVDATLLRPMLKARERLPIFQSFMNSWTHPDKPQPVQVAGIYSVELPKTLVDGHLRYREALAKRGNLSEEEGVLFYHGTGRLCTVGDSSSQLKLCGDERCRACSVLASSFSLNHVGTAPGRDFLRFGRGLYTTSVSSKAHDYTTAQQNSPFRAMIVARVALGRGYSAYRTAQSLTEPPPGYDSVLGKVGVSLNYDEQVVYNDDAIRPAYLIIYRPS